MDRNVKRRCVVCAVDVDGGKDARIDAEEFILKMIAQVPDAVLRSSEEFILKIIAQVPDAVCRSSEEIHHSSLHEDLDVEGLVQHLTACLAPHLLAGIHEVAHGRQIGVAIGVVGDGDPVLDNMGDDS
jgi:hypothetical protein